jgi:hypothetical protein
MYYSERDGKHNRVTVPRKFVNEVFTFIHKRQEDYAYYVRNRAADFEQCQRQDWQAKVSEYALSIFLAEQFKLPFTLPDMRHYSVKNKSYSPDLKYENVTLFNDKYETLNVHCKSCDLRTKEECKLESYSGESYAFSHDLCGKGGVDPLFISGGKSDWIGCVYLPFEGIQKSAIETYIRAIVPWRFINDNNLWMPSKKDRFKNMKRFVYAERLLEELELWAKRSA